MNKDDYLRQKKCASVEELTDEDVLEYFLNKNGDFKSFISAQIVASVKYMSQSEKREGFKCMREALDKGKSFICFYCESEGCVEVSKLPKGGFEFNVK